MAPSLILCLCLLAAVLQAGASPYGDSSQVVFDFLHSMQCGNASVNTGDPCVWDGIKCVDGNVTAMSVSCIGGSFTPLGALHLLAKIELEVEGGMQLPEGDDARAALPASLSDLVIVGGNFSTIPEGFFQGLSALNSLRISGAGLQYLPNDLPPSIVTLDVSHNKLRELPRNWDTWAGIKWLTLSYNEIRRFPYPVAEDGNAECTGPSSLVVFWGHDAGVAELCDVFDSLTSLSGMEVSGDLTSLPPTIGSAPKLASVYITNSKLSDLSPLSSMPKLTSLQVSGSLLASLPESLPHSLISIQLTSSKFAGAVPSVICSLPNVSVLDLSDNQLSSVPLCVAEMESLTILKLEANSITRLDALPPNLELLNAASNSLEYVADFPGSRVRTVDLSNNALSALPFVPAHDGNGETELDASVNKIATAVFDPNIKFSKLDLGFNRLAHLPHDMSVSDTITVRSNVLAALPCFGESSVIAIQASDNVIESIPDCISSLPSLETLSMSGNLLTAVPALPSTLITLTLGSNQLRSFPLNLPLLQALDLSNNLLEDMPVWSDALTSISLSGNNHLAAELPRALPWKLGFVSAARCNLTGRIPDAFAQVYKLDVSGNRFLEGGLGDYFVKSTELSTLDVSNTGMTAADMSAAFRTGNVVMSKLESLDVGDNFLTAADFVALFSAAFPSLTSLELSGNPISDASLFCTVDVSRLNTHALVYLGLRGTGLSWPETRPGLAPMSNCPIILLVSGTVDLSDNGISLVTNDGTTFRATTIITKDASNASASRAWGPAVPAPDPFLLLESADVIDARYGVYKGDLPAPDTVPNLRSIDIFSEQSDAKSFNGGWDVQPSTETVDYVSYRCPEYVTPVRNGFQGYKAIVHPNFYDHRFCRCVSGFHGLAPDCFACTMDGADCTAGDGGLKAKGLWPVMDGFEVAELVACTGSTTRSSCKSVDYSVNDEREYSVVVSCEDGYSDGSFLCAACESGFFAFGNSCYKCISSIVWLPIVYYLGKVCGTAALIVLGLVKMGGTARILLVHLSLFSVLVESSPALPSVMTAFGVASSTTQGAAMPGMECLSDEFGFEHKFLLAASLPVLLGLLSALLYVLGLAFKTAKLRQRAFVVFCFLWLTYYLSFVQIVMTVFNCTRYGESENGESSGHLTNALWISCDSDAVGWMKIVAGVYGIPVILATFGFQIWGTWRVRDHAKSDEVELSVTGSGDSLNDALLPSSTADSSESASDSEPFLIQPYKREFFWWELTITTRRFLLAMVLALVSFDSILRPVLVFFVLFFFLVLHLQCSPYRVGYLNVMETVSLCTLILGFFTLVLLDHDVDDVSGSHSDAGKFLGTAVVVVNALVLLVFFVAVAREKGLKLHRRIRTHLDGRKK